MKSKILTLLLMLSIQFLQAQYFNPKLQVLNPKSQWNYDVASIEEAQIIARPKGVYMEYNIYLTYNASSTFLNKTTDTTEIVHFFNLPSNAIVTDSWLWVNDVIVKADILDAWTASQIYEGIVKRNQDPSILKKTSPVNYEFRIFPLPGGKIRKVKLTILTPINFNGNRVTSTIPVNLMALSKVALKKINFKIPVNGAWSNPKIEENSNLAFTLGSNTAVGNFLEADIPYNRQNNLTLSFDNPMKDGVYLAKYQKGNDNYYALALQPNIVQYAASKPKKIAFAISHDDTETNLKWATFLSNMKILLKNNFAPTDSFNIIYNGLKPKIYSTKWIATDPTSIDKVFTDLAKENITDPNLPGVLAESIEYIAKTNGDAIVLCAATDQHSTITKGNNLMTTLEKTYPKMPIIHVIDYNDFGASYNWNNSVSAAYYGNEYFYSLLTQKTGGNYSSWRLNNFAVKPFDVYATEVLSGLNGLLKNFDLYTTLSNGYCHSRFNLGSSTSSIVPLNQTIIQSGKFEGSFPMNIQIAGEYNNQSFFKTIIVPEADVVVSDSTIGQIWTGSYLSNTEGKANLTNAAIKDMVNLSIKKRVLSLYTAFLSLEPGVLDTKPCKGCIDESIKTIATEDAKKDSVSFKVYPNPFRTQTNIEINLKNSNEKNVQLEIFNLAGQLVHQDEIEVDGNDKVTFSWDSEGVTQGMYIAKIKCGTIIKNIKLVKTE